MTAFHGNIERPREDESVAGLTLISGWALSEVAPVNTVEVFIDDELVGEAHTRRPRPDVEQLLPGWPATDAGFFAVVDLRNEVPRRARIRLDLRDDAGHRWSLERAVQLGTWPSNDSVSSDPLDASLLAWFNRPLEDRVEPPVVTVGALQYRDMHDLDAAYPDVFDRDRLAFFERMLLLREIGGEGALPAAVLEGVWVPPERRVARGLAPTWRDTAWGRIMSLWLDDDVSPGSYEQLKISRLGHLLGKRQPEPLPETYFRYEPALADPEAFTALRSRSRTITAPLGLTIVGHHTANSGLAEATRATVRSVQHSDCPYSIVDMGPNDDAQPADATTGARRGGRYALNVVHDNASAARTTFRQLGARALVNHYDIGYWYWEMAELPSHFAGNLGYLDEVWAPSAFVASALRPHTDVPIVVVPPSIDVSGASTRTRASFGLPDEPFLFLTMASAFSVIERKNPLGVLAAFRRAFPDPSRAGVGLVVKLNGTQFVPHVVAAIGAASTSAPVFLLDETLSRADLLALIDRCDAVVSLHRSEGFGLPIAEAMALGKPAIATAYSGNEAFTRADTAFPVGYELTQLATTLGPYEQGLSWAEPDLDQAAEHMRVVVGDGEHRRAVATTGQELIEREYSAGAIGPVIERRMHQIGAQLGLSA